VERSTAFFSTHPRPRGAVWKGAFLGLLTAALVVFSLDAAVFRTGWYSLAVEPKSFAGDFEMAVRNERSRQRGAVPQVLFAGDSRSVAFRPRLALEFADGRLAFGNAAVRGSNPRNWYYLFRDLDPSASRYAAIVIGIEQFEDEDGLEDLGDRLLDLHMTAGSLGLRDLLDFPFTFRSAATGREAFLGCLLKGSAYKLDFQEFLAHPTHRLLQAAYYREWSARKDWDSTGAAGDLSGLEVDWSTRTLKLPPSADADTRSILRMRVETPAYPQTGLRAAFRRQWFARIAAHYRGSPTRLIFLRVPASPIPRPASLAPRALPSVLRELASQPNIVLAEDARAEALERPEYFCDHSHLNAVGATRITRLAVERVLVALGLHR
jgi:hypothetical protein